MDDLISRKALIAEYDRVHIGPPGGARKLMEEAPAVDAVEVVRCGKCAHTETDGCEVPAIYCKKWDRWEMPEDFFCAYGERKTDA